MITDCPKCGHPLRLLVVDSQDSDLDSYYCPACDWLPNEEEPCGKCVTEIIQQIQQEVEKALEPIRQKCSSCKSICKESRNGERYECKHCGASLDADYNASINIRNRFLSGEHTVPHEQNQV